MNKPHALVLTVAVSLGLCGCSAFGGPKQPKLDLSTPESAVVSFTKAAAGGHVDLAMKCVHPEGHDYQDIHDVLTAPPGSHRYEARAMFEAIDPDIPMPIVKMTKEAERVVVVWRVTFKRAFKTKKGIAFGKGSTFDFDANLKRSGDQWLIYGL